MNVYSTFFCLAPVCLNPVCGPPRLQTQESLLGNAAPEPASEYNSLPPKSPPGSGGSPACKGQAHVFTGSCGEPLGRPLGRGEASVSGKVCMPADNHRTQKELQHCSLLGQWRQVDRKSETSQKRSYRKGEEQGSVPAGGHGKSTQLWDSQPAPSPHESLSPSFH